MTDYSTRYLVPTFNGLVAQIGLSVGVSAACMGVFEYNRRKKTLEYLYSPRCRLNVDPSPPVSRSFLGWIIPTVRLKEEFYINNVGLDAVMYLRFLRMCLQFCIFNGIIVGAVLLPIHYTAGGVYTEVPRLSIMNVPRDSNLFWAHVFLTYLVTLSWMFLLFKNYWQWMDLRREYTLQRIRHGEIAERSIFISRLPSHLRSDAALRQYFESLKMGPVESATVVQHCGRLSQKIDRRESVLNRLEKAHIELARAVLESIKAGRFTMDSLGPSIQTSVAPSSNDKTLVRHSTAALDDATLQQVALALFSDKKQYNKVRKSIFAKGRETRANRHLPAIEPAAESTAATQTPETAALSENEVPRPSDTIDIVVHQGPESVGQDWVATTPSATGTEVVTSAEKDTTVGTGTGAISGTAPITEIDESSPTYTIWDVLAALRRQNLEVFQPTRSEKRFKKGNRVDSIDYFVRKYNRLDRKVEELRDGSLRYKSTSFGFVTFKHHLSAQLCAQSKIDSRPQGLSVRLAMEPRDVLWSNLTASFRNRFTRSVAVNLSVWALIIFWIFPTSSFLLLTSLGQLSSRFTFLKPILEASPLIQSLLQNVLPIVFVNIFLALAPVIILAISKQELPISHSELEGKVLRRYYHFLIFNVLFVFMIGSAILKSIITLIQQPTNVFTMLAGYLPSGATFFVFYIVFNTCTHFLELLQVWAQLVIHLFVTGRKLSGTPRSLQRAITPWCFQYYYYYPQNILAFVITLIYSIISPLILLAAIFFFGFALIIFKHQLAYCYVRKYENSGRYFRHVFQYTSDGLIIFHVTMIGILWLNGALVGGFFIVALLGFTIYFKIMCTDLFRSRTKFLPLDTGLRNFDAEPDSNEEDDVDDEHESNSRDSTSTRSSARRAGLRRRPQGNIGKMVSPSVKGVPSSNLVGLGVSSSSLTSQGQPRTFSRLRVAAGQSDRYRKLVHSDSNEEISNEKQVEQMTAEPEEEHEEAKEVLEHTGNTLEHEKPKEEAKLERIVVPDMLKGYEASPDKLDMQDDAMIASEGNATYEDGFLADNGYFNNTFGPSHFLHACPDIASHFEHMSSKIVYQDQTSEFETYIHPALLKPLSRKMWLPKNPLYEHWDLDDTVEIDFVLNSAATEGKLKFRVEQEADGGVVQSPRFDLREHPQRRNTGASNFEEAAGVAPSSSNWEGCMAYSDPGLASHQSDHEKSNKEDEVRSSEVLRTRLSGMEKNGNSPSFSPRSPPLGYSVSSTNTPVLSPASTLPPRHGTGNKRRMSMPLDRPGALGRPQASPLSASGLARPRDSTPLRSTSHGSPSTPHSPGMGAGNTTTPLSSRSATFGATLAPRSSGIHHHMQNNYSSSGVGTVSGSSIRKTQPKTTRGFLNMIFGRLEDDDGHDDDGGDDKPQFGYETGGMWLSRRRSHDDRDDDDDEDEDEEDDNENDKLPMEAAHQPGANKAADSPTGARGGGALGVEELQLAQPSHLDLSDSLIVPSDTSARRSGSFMQRTMNFLRDPEK